MPAGVSVPQSPPLITRAPAGCCSDAPLLSPAPQLLRREAGAFAQCRELGPYDGRMDLAGGREARKAAIGARDDILAPDSLREPRDALRDRLGVLDEIRAVCDDAGDQKLALRQFSILPHPPFVFVARVAGLERIGPGVDAQHDVDGVLQFEIMHAWAHIDAVAGVI